MENDKCLVEKSILKGRPTKKAEVFGIAQYCSETRTNFKVINVRSTEIPLIIKHMSEGGWVYHDYWMECKYIFCHMDINTLKGTQMNSGTKMASLQIL